MSHNAVRENPLSINERHYTMTRKDKAKNTAQIVRGKMKRNAGDAAGDRGLSAEGRVDEAMGHIKQAAEHVKDVFKK